MVSIHVLHTRLHHRHGPLSAEKINSLARNRKGAQRRNRHLSLTGFGAHFKMMHLHISEKLLLGGHTNAGQGGD